MYKRKLSVKEKIDLRAYDARHEMSAHVERHDTLPIDDQRVNINHSWDGDDISYRLIHEFKEDCFTDLNLIDHPRAEEFFQLAWNEKHEEGLASVYEMLGKIVNLVLPQDPCVRWLDLRWNLQHAIKACTTWRQKVFMTKALQGDLIDTLSLEERED